MKTILIVDDNESICNILYHYGKEAGYTMVIAHTGQEGLTYFTNYKPDVILLDVMLPDIDGFEVCQDVYKRQDRPAYSPFPDAGPCLSPARRFFPASCRCAGSCLSLIHIFSPRIRTSFDQLINRSTAAPAR